MLDFSFSGNREEVLANALHFTHKLHFVLSLDLILNRKAGSNIRRAIIPGMTSTTPTMNLIDLWVISFKAVAELDELRRRVIPLSA